MIEKEKSREELEFEIESLKAENGLLRNQIHRGFKRGKSVTVPEPFAELFSSAEQTVRSYFKDIKLDPSKGRIDIAGQRYLLVRASAFSYDFQKFIKDMYSDEEEAEAVKFSRNFQFDTAHVLGREDAKNFTERMGLTDPIAKLSAGPSHFSHSGWAYVHILEESRPSPDKDFYLRYQHPYSFEADSWIEADKHADSPVCIMNCGYSSGWCEESFGIELTAVEVSCRACGDDACTFIMAPPDRIEKYLEEEGIKPTEGGYHVPSLFSRRKTQEKIQRSLEEKEVLLREIHHRVKNNLQIVSSLLNLQSHQIDSLPAKEKFKESMNRIQSMSLIHEMLYNTSDFSFVDMRSYTEGLISTVRNAYSMDLVGTRINAEINIDNVDIELERAIPLGLILNEVITNAVKYAFIGRKSGTLKVDMHKNEQGFELIVADDGTGFDLDEAKDGLGFQLVESLVDQVDGTLSITFDKGTHFHLTF